MMNRGIPFTKMTAGGNDFVLIEASDVGGSITGEKLALALCARRSGIGADGLFLLGARDGGIVDVGFWNADGSRAGLCANGTSCVARHCVTEPSGSITVRTAAGELAATVQGDRVRLDMPAPKLLGLDRSIALDGRPLQVHWVDTGCPHVVVLEEENGPVEFEIAAPLVRNHAAFGPAGANVDVVAVKKDTSGAQVVRFWERGVEGETLACGTGAVAVAVVLAMTDRAESPVRVLSGGGTTVFVHFELADGDVGSWSLEGSVKRVFSGVVPLE